MTPPAEQYKEGLTIFPVFRVEIIDIALQQNSTSVRSSNLTQPISCHGEASSGGTLPMEVSFAAWKHAIPSKLIAEHVHTPIKEDIEEHLTI